MKSFDFTQLGGVPWTQGRWVALQQSYTEAAEALGAIGANQAANVASVMYGMQSTTAGGTTTVSAGWFVWNGALVRFPSQTYSSPVAGGDAVYVVVTPTSAAMPQPYASSATPAVVDDVTGVLTVLASSTATDATHFQLANAVAWVVNNPAVNNEIADIITTINNLMGPWANVASPTITGSGGGTFSGGTVTYNKAKYINDNLVVWQLTLSGYVVAGVVNSLEIALPGYVSVGGAGWANPGAIFTGNINFGGTLYTVRGTISNSGATPVLTLTYEYAAFGDGGVDAINITVIAEVE